MAAPIGNQFWKLCPKTGRKPIYEDNEVHIFEQDCMDYFEQTQQRRDWDKQHWAGKDGKEVAVKVPCPFSKGGLFIFLGLSKDTWENYKSRKGFLDVITRVENIIYTQKLDGASTGHFNHNIIARELGLVDKREDDLKNNGKDFVTAINIVMPDVKE